MIVQDFAVSVLIIFVGVMVGKRVDISCYMKCRSVRHRQIGGRFVGRDFVAQKGAVGGVVVVG